MPTTSTSPPSEPASPAPASSVERAGPGGVQVTSRDLEWVDPVTGQRLGIRIEAGSGLLARLLRGGFEEAQSPPRGVIPPGPGVAA